jgi:hypothetical protein
MNEAEWFRPIDLFSAISFVEANLSIRRRRLYACGCSRLRPEFNDRQDFRGIVLLAEKLADGDMNDVSTYTVNDPLSRPGRYWKFSGRDYHEDEWRGLLQDVPDLKQLIHGLCYSRARGHFGREGYRHSTDWELRFLSVLREVVGNPFRPVAFDPRWRTSDTVGLARAIYDDRAFERLPILADALMDAGCEDEQIISHCRGEGPHVRGCWVVDLVLGKE